MEVAEPSSTEQTRGPLGRRRPLRSPLVRAGSSRVAFWEFFEHADARVHARARALAREGVYAFSIRSVGGGGSVVASVRSTDGMVTVVLIWSSGRPVPSRVRPSCPCPFRRDWCKHAMAAAYHLVDILDG